MANVYQMVTDRIVEQLKQGVVPWHKPWAGGMDGAISYTTRKEYSMLNQFLLGRPGEWLTWKQIQALKGKVKKGAKSSFCVFYQMVKEEVENPETGEKKVETYPVLKWYSVFHINDTEGIESKSVPVTPVESLKPIERAEEVIEGYTTREEGLTFICDRQSSDAYYNRYKDEVVVPMLSQYHDPEEYYSTTFHEFTHSTMLEKRCNRVDDRKEGGHNKTDYSREELVAEIGSAMICNRLGIDGEKAFKNQVAYIKGWLSRLQNDPKMIVWAAGRAEKAARYILNESFDTPAGA